MSKLVYHVTVRFEAEADLPEAISKKLNALSEIGEVTKVIANKKSAKSQK